MSRHPDIVVVGAGIFGVTAALELCRRGNRVRLLDPGPLPHPEAASTDISKAVRMDYGADVFYTDLAERAIRGWHVWNERWEHPLYHEDGFLLMTRAEMKPGEFEAEGYRLLRERGLPVERIDGATLVRRFPAWAAGDYVDGYFNPRAGWAESGRAVAQLLAEASEAGVRLHEGVRATGPLERGSRVAGVLLAGGETFTADLVVLASGAWLPAWLPELGDLLAPTAQPVLHFRPSDPGLFRAARFPVFSADISRTGWYGFPLNRDGVVKVAHHGAGRRLAADAPRAVSAEIELGCRRMLRRTFPALAGAPLVATRECLYCDSPDGDFWIDHHPEREGLVVAGGGSGHAFKFAPVLGELIADVVERRPNPAAARFAWREPDRRGTEQARSGSMGPGEA